MCSGSTNPRNQTPDSAFEFLTTRSLKLEGDGATTGIGTFIVAAPEQGIYEFRSVHVEGISYQECIKRGQNCEAFQWCPTGFTAKIGETEHTINTISDLKALAFFCSDTGCSPRGCPMGCVCYDNQARCKPI